MKKLLIIIAILCMLAVGFVTPVSAATPVTATFNLSQSRMIPKSIHGVNTNWYGFLPISQSVTQLAIKSLDFTQIRFPGGTVGNYYDWVSFAPNWTLINSLSNVPGNITGLKPRYDFHIKELSPLIFDPIVRSMGKEGTYVVNFSYNTNDEIITGMNRMKQAGITPKRLEFGNELYFRATAGLTPEVYIQRAEAINTKAKQLWPDVKTALVADRKLWRSGANNEPWDIPNLSWYDAVIIHSYSTVNSLSFTTYPSWVTGGESDAGSRRQHFSQFVSGIKSRYPGKELWLTEWDISEIEDQFANTFAQSYYVYDFLLGILQYPIVTVANHHSLNDIYKIRAAMDAQYFNPSNYVSVPNNQYTADQFFVKRAAYWPLAWIGKAFTRYNRFSIAATSPSTTAVYFYNQANPDNGSLALINKSAATLAISVSGIPDFDSKQWNLSLLTKSWDAKSKEGAEFTPVTSVTAGSDVSLPPYAIAYLTPSSNITANPADLTDEEDTPGDEVNFHDYNVLLTGFGTTYDIFDYNELVGRWGE